MIITGLIFLFILYSILEKFKYEKIDYSEIEEEEKTHNTLKADRKLSKEITIIKLIIYSIFYILLIINHFVDPLSKSTGIKGFIISLLIASFFLIICIVDYIKVRKKS